MKEVAYLLFDTETTGNSEEDRVIQIGLMVFYGKDKFEYFDELCKSEVEIKYEAMEVHNITPELLEGKPSCIETNAYKKIVELNNNDNYLIAHNIEFDLEMIKKEGFKPEYKLIDTLRCARHLYPELDYHRLQYLRYALNLYKKEADEANRLGIELKAHDAISDVLVMRLFLSELVKKVRQKYSDKNPMDILVELSQKPVMVKKIKFGKYKGELLEDIAKKDMNYINWLLSKDDLDKDLKYTIEKLKEKYEI